MGTCKRAVPDSTSRQPRRNQYQIVFPFVLFEKSDAAFDRFPTRMVFMDSFDEFIVEV